MTKVPPMDRRAAEAVRRRRRITRIAKQRLRGKFRFRKLGRR